MNPLTRDQLFDAVFLDRLRLLALRLRKRRQLMRRGAQSTTATGFTREFKDYRHYAKGEDYRAIDWRLYARLDKLFVRLYEETQELHLHILVDTSGSMAYPFEDKRRQALRFAVALAYLGLSNQQRVSLYSMSDALKIELPPMRGQGSVEKIIQSVLSLSYQGLTDLEKCFDDFHPTRQRYGVIFVISDFYGRDVVTAAESVSRAAAWPGETHFLQIMHPAERLPDIEGEVELAEIETGERRRFHLTKRDAQRHAEAYDAFVANLERACVSRQIDFLQVRTDEPFEDRFLEVLTRGAALAGA